MGPLASDAAIPLSNFFTGPYPTPHRTIYTLQKIGPLAALSIVPILNRRLKTALQDRNYSACENLAKQISLFGIHAAEAIPNLIELLCKVSKRHKEGWEAARALENIGEQAIPALSKLVDHTDFEVRRATVAALRVVGVRSDSGKTIPILTKALNDKEERIRDAAASALEIIFEKAWWNIKP